MNERSSMLLLLAAVLTLLGACNESESSTGNVRVFKSSGYVQCEPDTRVTADTMALELTNAGVDVLCSATTGDGMMHIALCGAASGEINVFLIRGANRENAERLGFRPISSLPEYSDDVCLEE